MRQQEVGESADNFITALHCLAEHCGYGQLYSEKSEQLQMDPKLTLEKAVIRIRQSELVKKQQEELKANFKSDTATNIDIVYAQQRPYNKGRGMMQSKRPAMMAEKQIASEKSIPCKRCGKTPSHSKFHCPAKQAYCNLCRKKGHYAKACRSRGISEVNMSHEEHE